MTHQPALAAQHSATAAAAPAAIATLLLAPTPAVQAVAPAQSWLRLP